MGLWKRGKWYWADFAVNGTRYRVSLKDRGKRISVAAQDGYEKAIRAEERAKSEADQGELSLSSRNFVRLGFTEASERYLATRRLELKPSSQVKERQLLVKLREYFKAKRLSQITTDDVLAYREWRAALPGTAGRTRNQRTIGPAIINMEVGCLRRILKRAKRWHLIAGDVKPLREPRSIGRALTHEEKLRLLKTASRRSEWETAHCAAVLALATTMRTCELRGLRWADVNLIDRTLTVEESKTEAGERVIPLTPEAFDTLLKLRRRAEMFGPVEPAHYVFAAFRPKFRFHDTAVVGMEMSGFDPSRPLGSWRTAWRTLTRKAGLAGLRFHDLRHTAITTLAESEASEQTLKALAGHVSRKMLERYSHIRLQAKRAAIKALSDRPAQRSIPARTSQTTSQNSEAEGISATLAPQVIENAGRPERTRTVDLYRVKVAL